MMRGEPTNETAPHVDVILRDIPCHNLLLFTHSMQYLWENAANQTSVARVFRTSSTQPSQVLAFQGLEILQKRVDSLYEAHRPLVAMPGRAASVNRCSTRSHTVGAGTYWYLPQLTSTAMAQPAWYLESCPRHAITALPSMLLCQSTCTASVVQWFPLHCISNWQRCLQHQCMCQRMVVSSEVQWIA